MNNINSLPPFKRLCVTIGNLPSSYVDSMSYYECLMWLCKYLKETVIPAINNNAEAVKEIQDWIDTVDLQDYVDEKLDEMAEDGTLARIIEDYATIPELTARVTTLEEEVNKKDKYLLVGDSYGALSNDTWIDKLITLFGNDVDCQKIALGGLGFAHTSSLGYTFLTYMQHVESDITDKDRVTKIIVGGGYNDYNESFNDITSAITAFCNYCKGIYPNAKVYIACFGFNKAISVDGVTIRSNLKNIVVPAYSNSINIANDPIYIANSENILKNDALLGDDNVHPTALGQEYIAKKLYNYIRTNSLITNNIIKKSAHLTLGNYIINVKYKKDDYNTVITTEGPFSISSFPANTNFVSGGEMSSSIANYIGDFDFTDIYPNGVVGDSYSLGQYTCSINCTEGNFRNVPCTLWLKYDRKLYVIFHTLNSDHTTYQTYSSVSYFSINEPFNFNIQN